MTRPGWTFYYDGECGMCSGLVRLLRALDWMHRLRWVSSQSLEVPPRGLSRESLETSAYLETRSGVLREGFYAIRSLLLQIPLTFPIGLVMWLPWIDRLGVPVYRWVARNRHRIPWCVHRTRADSDTITPFCQTDREGTGG